MEALNMQNKALTRNETEKENVQTPLSSRKGVTSNGSSKTSHRSRHRGIFFIKLFHTATSMLVTDVTDS